MSDGTVHFERLGDHGAVATLDRADRRNALNAEMCAALRTYLEANSQLRAVVIAGAGPAFCAGADLVTRFDEGEDTFRPAFDALQTAIETHPGAIIAAVHGAAIGAGTQLLTTCDIVVAGPYAKFGIPAAKLGIVMSPGNLARLVRRVGDLAARNLLLSGDVITTDEALRIGLASRSVTDASAAARDLAQQIAALAPLSTAGHKAAIAAVGRAIDPSTERTLRAIEERAFASEDLREGIAAFRDKRPPEFKGR